MNHSKFYDTHKNNAKIGKWQFVIRMNSGHYPDTPEGRLLALTETTVEYNTRTTDWKKYYADHKEDAQVSLITFRIRITRDKDKYGSWWIALTTPQKRKTKKLKELLKNRKEKQPILNLLDFYNQNKTETSITYKEFIEKVSEAKKNNENIDYKTFLISTPIIPEVKSEEVIPEWKHNSKLTILEYLTFRYSELEKEEKEIQRKKEEILKDVIRISSELLKK